jgi:hypothetical protein
MFNLARLSMAAVGTGLIVTACAAPTDEEIAPAQQPEQTSTDDSSTVTEEVSEDVTASGLDENGEFAADMRNEDGELAVTGHGGGRRCDRSDNWKCRRGLRGWRWVRTNQWGGHHGGDRCCMRVLHRPHW